VFPSTRAYTDRLYKKLEGRVHGDLEHVKLGCDGEKTTDMLFGTETKCDYVTGTQLGDAMMWLGDPTVDVVLVTIDIGANDINRAARLCAFDMPCIQSASLGILGNVGQILGALRSTGYTGPIVGMNYYSPNVTAVIGRFAGVPGEHAPDPGFAVLSDALTQGFNGGLATVYGLFGSPVADVYGTFASGDLSDNGGKYQKKGNGVADGADAACKLTYMCPKDETAKANIHPNPKGYKAMWLPFGRSLGISISERKCILETAWEGLFVG
jgi:lysophospholipase L1-like esterase